MRQVIALLAALLIGMMPGTTVAAIYKWVDGNGVVTFRDTPPPEGVQGQVVDATPSFSGGEPANATGAAPSRKAPAAAASRGRVELYSTSWCPYCKSAANFLRSNNIPFVEYDIEKDPAAARRKAQFDSQPGVPFAVINGKNIHGFNPHAYKEALGMK